MDTRIIATNLPLRRSRQEKERLIEQWRESGKTKKSFCAELQLNYQTFIGWVNPKKKRKRFSGVLEDSPGFIPVQIQHESSGVFAEAKLVNGNSVCVYQYVPAGYLRSLLV
jgi:hypothetical protein